MCRHIDILFGKRLDTGSFAKSSDSKISGFAVHTLSKNDSFFYGKKKVVDSNLSGYVRWTDVLSEVE